MSLLQILFIAGCGVIGYWSVSRVISELYSDRRKKNTAVDNVPPLINQNTPWHEVLGLSPDADMPSIMQAYTRLIRQYRPEQADSLAPEVRVLCEQRARLIEQAYQQALQGFK